MKKVFLFGLTGLLLWGCGHEKKAETPSDPQVILSEVKDVKSLGILHYSGSIEPFQSIPLTFQTNGIVQKVLVNEGDIVRQGQLLATVDKTDAQSMYEMTLSKYKQAKDAYKRLKEVHDNGSLPDVKWVEMETNLQQAESSLEIAKNNLNKSNLYAPVSGIIGKRNIDPGMNSIGSTFSPLEIVKIESVYVKIAVSENEIAKIKKGLHARFTVSALGDKTYEGTVTNVGVVADRISRTYEVNILVRNQNMDMKPGMVCDVNLGITPDKNIMGVPYSAVDNDSDNNKFVYVVDVKTKRAHKRIIQTGNYQNKDIEVISGLSLGEKVVSEGKQKLSDHCKVSF
ncbi:MAG: efflux RND transporter periplasmic adaptor subunit [Bacteroidales bacterium]|nr:efflux RND transporter periplasmic adaptor subunit [Bacteroidales bacterium]